jgi:glycosyltransferase involved in cell wall biosynthesis
MSGMKASIVIRSKNEERFIGSVLQQVLEQEFADPYEVIVLDSGSQDRTLDIVRRFPVRLEMIPPEQFTFGAALNRGAVFARGEYVVFLSAHCVPCHRSWLQELTNPFAQDPLIAATYGRQEPIPGVNPIEEVALVQAYTLRADNTVRAHFSNANSAVRKRVWCHHPFDEEITSAEDFLWAYSLPAPYTIQYVHSAGVFHSHPPRLRYWWKRWYDDGLMVPYLARRYGAPGPSAEPLTPQPHVALLRRIGATMLGLWKKREFVALCCYPLYALSRRYFYRKGQRDGARLYALSNAAPTNEGNSSERSRL